MLVDWRAPAAQAFYQATPAAPQGLTRRRHLRLRRREVIGVDDDLLDADDLNETDRETLSGEAALLASLTAKRTGHMGDIVATIQGEQDRIIRSDARGMLVVQGGPGTGKTAVALHRAAYLLYTHRERLERAGVLVVAPNSVFLRYIDQVLPSLGETGVVLATPEQMVPGVTVTGRESDEVARLKGDARMAKVIAQAALQRKRVPKTPVIIPYESEELQLTRRAAISARRRALGTRRRHNGARSIFIRSGNCWPSTNCAKRSTKCGRGCPRRSSSRKCSRRPKCSTRLRVNCSPLRNGRFCSGRPVRLGLQPMYRCWTRLFPCWVTRWNRCDGRPSGGGSPKNVGTRRRFLR
jgi:DNA helicase IV